MKFFRLRVFRRMIFSILAVVLTFYVVGLLSNAYSRRVLSQEILRSTQARSRFFAAQLDLQVESLMLSQTDMISDTQVLGFYVLGERLSPYQRTETIRGIADKLTSIKRLHAMVSDLWLYFPQAQVQIRGNQPIYHADKRMDIPKERQLIQDGGSLILTTSYPRANWSGASAPAFIVQSEITPARIGAQLGRLLPERTESLFLLNLDGSVWVGTADAPPALDSARRRIAEAGAISEAVELGGGLVACHPLESLDLVLAYCLPGEVVRRPLMPYQWLNVLLTALSALLLLIYSGYIRRAFMQPINRLLQRVSELPDGRGLPPSPLPKDEFSAIYQQYEEMSARNDRLIHENYQSRFRARIAELRQLQYQIRPHFLYNSLFLIYRMAQSAHCEDIAEYAGHLGSYYQYITQFADHEVPIEQELDHIRHYIDIQRTRFGGRIAVTMSELPREAQGMRISALVLQPLVENAYEHGLGNKLSGGELDIRMAWSDGRLSFSVRDNGEGMSEEALNSLLAEMGRAELSEDARGLANTNLRLVMRYGPESGLHIESGTGRGLTVRVSIPRSVDKYE